jgi:hypothetical protein
LIQGQPVFGTGAGLRPLGSDPNFVNDSREIFNISVPIVDDHIGLNYNGNGRNKWPNPSLVTPNWRDLVKRPMYSD